VSSPKLAEFGDPILRQKAKQVDPEQISSKQVQSLIADMRHILTEKKLGIGLAAPQVGSDLALAVVCIHPMPHRLQVQPFDLVLINAAITERIGRRDDVWEGCISSGPGKAGLFAKTPRYDRIKVRYLDASAMPHHRIFSGLAAQVIQHEIDHLNGILFVDHVKDTRTFMTYGEYKKRIAKTSV
jgi:peptide deformylase